MSTELHYFRCRNCRTVLAVTVKIGNAERCTCRSWMLYQFSVHVDTDERRAGLASRGRVYNPHYEPQPWTCVRCGKDFMNTRPHDRPDGKSCTACYQAEDHPPVVLLTPEQIAERQAKRTAFRRDMDDAHERAHQLVEQEQR